MWPSRRHNRGPRRIAGRTGAVYLQSDIFSYVPSQSFDVILFRDSIYYVPRRQITPMLQRYAQYLEEGGVFIVRMASVDKYQDIVEIIETHFSSWTGTSPTTRKRSCWSSALFDDRHHET